MEKDPIDAGLTVLQQALVTLLVHRRLVQLGNERQYVSDKTGISVHEHRNRLNDIISTVWDVRFAYAQIVTTYPGEVAQYLEGMFS